MTDTTYNGWTNYATWRVCLEIFDGFVAKDYFSALDSTNVWGVGQSLKEYAEQVIFECGECNPTSLAGSYAQAFLSDVNWYEIAEHILKDEEMPDEVEE